MLPVADYLYRSGKGVFYPPKTTKGKKKEGKCGEKGKKCGKKKGKKTKGGEKKDRKKVKGKSKAGKTERAGKRRTENDKEQNEKKHKFSPTTSQAPGLLVCKKRTFPKKRSLISGMLILIISTGIIYPVRTKQRLEIENPAAFASDFS